MIQISGKYESGIRHAGCDPRGGMAGGWPGVAPEDFFGLVLVKTLLQSVFAVYPMRMARVMMAPTVIVIPVRPSKKKL